MENSLRAAMFGAVALAGVFAAGPALADGGCANSPKSEWKSVEQVKQTAAESNFTNVVKVILEDGCYEVVTLNAEGQIVGVHFDPVSLKLVKVEDPR